MYRMNVSTRWRIGSSRRVTWMFRRSRHVGVSKAGSSESWQMCSSPRVLSWSVTAMKSSGTRRRTSSPSDVTIGSPRPNRYATVGSSRLPPMMKASSDQLVCTCKSPKYAFRSGFGLADATSAGPCSELVDRPASNDSVTGPGKQPSMRESTTDSAPASSALPAGSTWYQWPDTPRPSRLRRSWR